MSAPVTGAMDPGHATRSPTDASGSLDGARAAAVEGETPREGLRRTVSWADAQPDKDKSVGLVAVREFEPRYAHRIGRARAILRAEPSPMLRLTRSEAGDTEDGYGAYGNNRKGCCSVQ